METISPTDYTDFADREKRTDAVFAMVAAEWSRWEASDMDGQPGGRMNGDSSHYIDFGREKKKQLETPGSYKRA